MVAKPAAVRYAWADDTGNANLCNKEGLPAEGLSERTTGRASPSTTGIRAAAMMGRNLNTLNILQQNRIRTGIAGGKGRELMVSQSCLLGLWMFFWRGRQSACPGYHHPHRNAEQCAGALRKPAKGKEPTRSVFYFGRKLAKMDRRISWRLPYHDKHRPQDYTGLLDPAYTPSGSRPAGTGHLRGACRWQPLAGLTICRSMTHKRSWATASLFPIT